MISALFWTIVKLGLKGVFNYITSACSKNTIKNYIKTYTVILEQLASLHSRSEMFSFRLKDLKYISLEQYDQLVNKKSDDELQNPNLIKKTFSNLFTEQVYKTPDNTCVVCKDRKLTYADLDRKSNNLMMYIKSLNIINSNNLIVLFLDKNEYVMISILGVMKAGGAYVPIDVEYPDSRICYILKDTKAELILANKRHEKRLNRMLGKDSKINIIFVDDNTVGKKSNEKTSTPSQDLSKYTNLAYVIYTSGSTGNPKGVMIRHLSLVNLILAMKHKYFFNSNNISTYSMSSYAFDIFGLEYGLPLLNGDKVVLANHNFYTLDCSTIGFIQITPSVCELKLDAFQYSSKTTLLIGAEALKPYLLNQALKKFDIVINMYGPTETTIWSSGALYSSKLGFEKISIGRMLPGEFFYVLNDDLSILPTDAVGELYISGIGVGEGYLNNKTLTKEKFISNPFQSEECKSKKEYGLDGANSILYKTGDLVRRMSCGDLEYIGRTDSQAKIRGFRVELGEIEKVLLSYPEIENCVVILKEKSCNSGATEKNKYIVGFYTSNKRLPKSKILEYLKDGLPRYMIPNTLLQLPNIPLNTNGKLDISALQKLEVKLHNENDLTPPPKSFLEKVISRIWADLLLLPQKKISVTDDFFELGGNSILVVKLVNKINAEIPSEYNTVHVRQVYVNSTIRKLVKIIEKPSVPSHKKILILSEASLDKNIIPTKQSSQISSKGTVFLTGATGFVGVHILDGLLLNLNIKKIYCLVRANSTSEGLKRIENSLKRYKLSSDSKKVIPILGSMSEKNLGINSEILDSLAEEVCSVIHSAVYMDHFKDYNALKQSNVGGLEEIFRFACTKTQKNVQVISTTSIFSCNSPEEENDIKNEEHYSNEGYSTSKWVAEGLCHIARQRGINCNIF